MKTKLHETLIPFHANHAWSSNLCMLALACVMLASACFPGGVSMDSSSETGFDSGDGDGDGDPGDGDGDPACEGSTPVVTCSNEAECWASASSWTADASAATAETVNLMLEAGVWVPANLDVGDECWNLLGTNRHVCIVDVCGATLLGTPAAELPLEPPGPECDFTGVWESTMSGLGLPCFGLFDGVAVELRAAVSEVCNTAPHRELAEVTCTADGCKGRWQESDLWSVVQPADDILSLPMTDPSVVWPCQSQPVVDGCFVIDGSGHIACVRIMNGWAVPVAPCCAVAGFANWLAIGEGMSAFAD